MTTAAQPIGTPYLDIQHVSAAYGATKVLDDVSLSVDKGELIALLGSSGCGKTTLLRSIAGFVTPTAGRIVVDGRDLTGLPPDKRGMLGAMNPHLESYLRTQIVRSLVRPLPREQAEQIERWVAAAGDGKP